MGIEKKLGEIFLRKKKDNFFFFLELNSVKTESKFSR